MSLFALSNIRLDDGYDALPPCIIPMTSKTCTRCMLEQIAEEDDPKDNSKKDGYRSICRDFTNKFSRLVHTQGRDAINQLRADAKELVPLDNEECKDTPGYDDYKISSITVVPLTFGVSAYNSANTPRRGVMGGDAKS